MVAGSLYLPISPLYLPISPKVAGSFRDLALLSILQLALTTLQQLQTGALAATGTWG